MNLRDYTSLLQFEYGVSGVQVAIVEEKFPDGNPAAAFALRESKHPNR